MPDLARRLCLKKCLKRAALSHYLLKVCGTGIMYLIKVDVIRAEIIKAYINILCHRLLRARHTLCSENETVAHALERVAEIFLADGISARGVDEVNSLIYQVADQPLCALGINLLNRYAAKAEARYFKSCFS